MAIRFVDVEPEKAEAAKPAPTRRPRAPEAAPESGPEPTKAPAEADRAGAPPAASEAGEAPLPGLPHAKPEPKPRGRKKPMSAVGADKQGAQAARQGASEKPEAPSAPLLEGLLPELQAHAKPAPKPRGRKKAFG